MSWEHSITLAYIGSALVIAYIAHGIKSDEENFEWTRFIPIGLRTILYFVSMGLLLFSIGVQTPILMENEIYVNESVANATHLLQQNIIGGVSLMTNVFWALIVILMILSIITIIQNMLLKKKNKGKDRNEKDYGNYEQY